MVSWQFYLSRKRTTLGEFCLSQNVKTYADLLEAFRPTGALPPSEAEAQPFFVAIETPVATEPVNEIPVAAKNSKRKENV